MMLYFVSGKGKIFFNVNNYCRQAFFTSQCYFTEISNSLLFSIRRLEYLFV